MLQRLCCYGFGMIIGILMAGAYVFAQHGGSWQDTYKSADGSSCCGPKDCKVVPVALIGRNGTMIEALVMGVKVILPAKSVHQSEDTQSYWCQREPGKPPADNNIRCLFVVTAM